MRKCYPDMMLLLVAKQNPANRCPTPVKTYDVVGYSTISARNSSPLVLVLPYSTTNN